MFDRFGDGMVAAPGGMIAFGAAAGGAEMDFASATNAGSSSGLAAVDKIRNVFPETWLWTNSTAGYRI